MFSSLYFKESQARLKLFLWQSYLAALHLLQMSSPDLTYGSFYLLKSGRTSAESAELCCHVRWEMGLLPPSLSSPGTLECTTEEALPKRGRGEREKQCKSMEQFTFLEFGLIAWAAGITSGRLWRAGSGEGFSPTLWPYEGEKESEQWCGLFQPHQHLLFFPPVLSSFL